jgi:hypothetical protein
LHDAPIPSTELDRLLQTAGDAVLVGGQALAFWISYYGVPIDDAPDAIVSRDADFLGDREDAQRFSDAIGGTVEYPKTMSILAGVVRKKISLDEEFEVDVLRALNGLSPSSVHKHAKRISDPRRNARYFVMSPIDCLISRLENLRTIAEKQTSQGIWQARIAARVARSHLEGLLQNAQEKEAIRGAIEILRAATHAMGLNAFKKHGIDLLDAIPIERFMTKNFVEQQWARSTSRIRQIRALQN